MKTKCPHCEFKFDTDENLTPPFKIGDKVKVFKKYSKEEFGYVRPDFDYIGKIIRMQLCRANDIYDNERKKDCWLITASFRIDSKYEGNQEYTFWDYQVKRVKK